jgi:hypothetical protein
MIKGLRQRSFYVDGVASRLSCLANSLRAILFGGQEGALQDAAHEQ